MNRWILVGGAAALAVSFVFACNGGGDGGAQPDSGTPSTPTSTPPGPPPDGGKPVDAGRTSCLDRPGSLARPPGDRLPCELIPPGLTL
jgi:hypothetical protein